MNVISVGTDRKLFEADSAVRKRAASYGTAFTELHIIVFAKKSFGFKDVQIAGNVWVYPTNSLTKFLYMHDAVNCGQKIAQDRKLSTNDLVISAQDPFETGKAAIRLKKALKAKLQLQVHTDFLSPHFARSSILNRIRVSMARDMLSQADEIRVVSKRIKDSILKQLPKIPTDKIDILPIATDPNKYKDQAGIDLRRKYPQFNFVILIASRLTYEKNVSLALDIFKKTLDVYNKAGLLIVGNGPEEESLKKKVRKLGIEKSVIFEPWQENLAPYYKTAQAFMVPSLYEGYGLTLVEAGLSGAAIVTADVGIVGEVLIDGRNALVCPVGDTECFSRKISSLIRDNALRQSLKANVSQDMEAFIGRNSEEYVRKYGSLIKKALTATPS